MIDCNVYENCPKQGNPYTLTLNKDVLKIGFVGCWGTYCRSGEHESFKAKIKDGKVKEEREKTVYGSKYVVELMEEYYKDNKADAIILAGDNVYSKEPSEEKRETYERCKKEKDERCLKNVTYDIEEQLDKGFDQCMATVNSSQFLIGVGNHDIETCDILNKQLNYEHNKWVMPGISYQYIYKMKEFDVNFVFIDTNLYDLSDSYCNENKVDIVKEVQNQFEWMKRVLKKPSKKRWNVVIGHAPFIWNLHKKKQTYRVTFAEHMAQLKDHIDLYCCADEHNQQYLKIEGYPTEIVSGSGGASLDDILEDSPMEKYTLYGRKTFGFVDLAFTKSNIHIEFIN